MTQTPDVDKVYAEIINELTQLGGSARPEDLIARLKENFPQSDIQRGIRKAFDTGDIQFGNKLGFELAVPRAA